MCVLMCTYYRYTCVLQAHINMYVHVCVCVEARGQPWIKVTHQESYDLFICDRVSLNDLKLRKYIMRLLSEPQGPFRLLLGSTGAACRHHLI